MSFGSPALDKCEMSQRLNLITKFDGEINNNYRKLSRTTNTKSSFLLFTAIALYPQSIS